VKRIIEEIRQHWNNTIIVFRGDSHFCSPELMRLIEAESDIFYVTGLTGNSKLNKNVENNLNEAKARYDKLTEKKTLKLYHSFYYQAESWDSCRRVVAKLEYGSKGTNIRFVISNLKDVKAKVLYEGICCKRGEIELFIKNHKIYLKSSRTSCH
jgi:hypothetical protein